MKIQSNFISSFFKNSAILLIGIVISQLLTFFCLPIITMLYSPEEIGLSATFLSICSITSIFFSLQYHQPILIPKKRNEYTELVYISLFFSAIVLVLSSLLFFFFGDKIFELSNISEISNFKMLIPIISATICLNQIFTNWHSKEKKFERVSSNNILMSLGNNGFSIFFGKLAFGINGLIFSRLIGNSFASLRFIYSFFTTAKSYPNLLLWKKLLTEYIKFPKITLPHSLFNTLGNELPVIIITGFFSPKITGFYFLASRISKIPFTMVTSSLYNVYFEEFSRVKNKMPYFKRRFIQLLLISMPLLVLAMITLPYIINFFFDNRYDELIKMSYYLIPLYYIKLGSIFTVSGLIYFKKNDLHFFLELTLFFLNIISLFVAIYFTNFYYFLALSLCSTSLIILFRFNILIKLLK